jgi:hypothetical protein
MNYIKLIKELKTDFTGNFYLKSNYLGIAYARDNKIIGTFKGDYNDRYLVPFKMTPDKGTYSRYYTAYLCSAGSKYAVFNLDTNYNRIVYIYPYLWDNDKVEYDYLWNLSRSGIFSRFNYAYGVFLDDSNYYLAEHNNIVTSYPKAVNSLSKWNTNTEVFTYTLDDVYNYDPYVRPKISETYYSYPPLWVHFSFTITPVLYDYNPKKIRFQVASDSNFTNLLSDTTSDITYDSLWQQQVIYKDFYIHNNDTYLIQYARARAENADGSSYSNWTPTIVCNFNSPSNQSYTYTNFPSDYSGTYTYKQVYGMVKRGDYLDILEFVDTDTVTNGSQSDSYDFYIKTYDLNGNLINTKFVYTRSNLSFPIGTQQMLVRNNKTYILDMDSNYLTLRVFQFDGTNVVTKTISPQHYSFSDALLQSTGDLVVFTDSNQAWDTFYIYSWNWDTETATNLNLPMGIYNDLSNTFDGNGFWFEFDDGTYVGVAFAYLEQINRAMSFIQFERSSMRKY